MTPLPAPLQGGPLVAWRLDPVRHAAGWDSGEGAYRAGGRWNSVGVRAVYCSIDPSTSILEVAVHKRFRTLDTVPYMITSLRVLDPGSIHVVWPEQVPNPNWLRPGEPSEGQQSFGDGLLAANRFVMLPSVVSPYSWNLVFVGATAAPAYERISQERFALDSRLHPPRTVH